MLCIMADGPVNMPSLRMAANLVGRRIGGAVAATRSRAAPGPHAHAAASAPRHAATTEAPPACAASAAAPSTDPAQIPAPSDLPRPAKRGEG